MHAPPGFGPRPEITGWYAEFEDLALPPGAIGYVPIAEVDDSVHAVLLLR